MVRRFFFETFGRLLARAINMIGNDLADDFTDGSVPARQGKEPREAFPQIVFAGVGPTDLAFFGQELRHHLHQSRAKRAESFEGVEYFSAFRSYNSSTGMGVMVLWAANLSASCSCGKNFRTLRSLPSVPR